MNHQDAEMSDVIVVLIDEPGMTIKDAAAKLQTVGLAISDIDEDNDVVEGTILTEKVGALRKLEFVKYVRDVFKYIADYPQKDPRNLDAEDDCDPSDVDDAGA